MAARVDLHNRLVEIIGDDERVYYNPPESLKISYPCIVYGLDKIKLVKANNKNYKKDVSYTVKLIDHDPDSAYVDLLLELPYCQMVTSPYVADNLWHYVFEIYQ